MNATYEFNTGDGLDTIQGAQSNGGIIKLDANVSKTNIYLYTDTIGDLCIDYGATAGNDVIKVKPGSGFSNGAYNGISEIVMNDGSFISASAINKVISSITAYATLTNIGTSTTASAITADKANPLLMDIVLSGWNS